MEKKADKKQLASGLLRRFLIRELNRAGAALDNDGLPSRQGVHLARKRLKRARAVLELVRDTAPYAYQVEKQAVRDIARSLAAYRDKDAMIETLDRIQHSYSEKMPVQVYDTLWHSFARRREESASQSADGANDIASAVKTLAALSRRMRLLPLDNVSIETLMTARDRSLRRMRRARKKALGSHESEFFHRWRRQTKILLYQEQFLKKLGRSKKRTRRRLETIGELLGCANDAAMLQAYLDKQPDSLEIDQNIRIVRTLARDQELMLHSKALAATVKELH